MTSKRAPEGQGSATLGDLLQADGSPTESEWRRLVEAIADGDERALRTLFERSHRIVFTVVVRICGSRELAEEVTLDVFHDVWRRAKDYRPTGTVIAWIAMQARSRAIDRVRFEQRQKRTPVDGEVEPASRTSAADAHERQRVLRDALATLTGDERSAIETAFFSELTYAETAERLDQPEGTVKTRVRSALAKLRKAIRGDR